MVYRKDNTRWMPILAAMFLVALSIVTLIGNIQTAYTPSYRQHATAVPRDTLETVYRSPMYKLDANGISQARISQSDLNSIMPPIPDCKELSVCPEDPEWDGFISNAKDGKPGLVTVELKSKGRVIARHEFLRINTADYEQTFSLHAQGHEQGWISNIQVIKEARGNGLGRLMVRAGDAALKLVPGGEAVHIFVDNAGWAERVLNFVPESDWLIKGMDTIWAYIVR